MARVGITQAQVEEARNVLLARGVRPSIEAVRAELGNTGSKTTISRYLKPLQEMSVLTSLLNHEFLENIGEIARRMNEVHRSTVAAEREAHIRAYPEWITLHICHDTADISCGWSAYEIDIRPSNIISMTVMPQAHNEPRGSQPREDAHAMLCLNEPQDVLADDDVHVARALRHLRVYESVDQIRELLGRPSRNGLARHEVVPGYAEPPETRRSAH
jgi:hypothetical protein